MRFWILLRDSSFFIFFMQIMFTKYLTVHNRGKTMDVFDNRALLRVETILKRSVTEEEC